MVELVKTSGPTSVLTMRGPWLTWPGGPRPTLSWTAEELFASISLTLGRARLHQQGHTRSAKILGLFLRITNFLVLKFSQISNLRVFRVFTRGQKNSFLYLIKKIIFPEGITERRNLFTILEFSIQVYQAWKNAQVFFCVNLLLTSQVQPNGHNGKMTLHWENRVIYAYLRVVARGGQISKYLLFFTFPLFPVQPCSQ